MIDLTFFVAGCVFAITALLACRSGTRIPIYSSLPTAIALLVDGVAFLAIDLWYSAVITVVTSAAWFFIAARRRLVTKSNKKRYAYDLRSGMWLYKEKEDN